MDILPACVYYNPRTERVEMVSYREGEVFYLSGREWRPKPTADEGRHGETSAEIDALPETFRMHDIIFDPRNERFLFVGSMPAEAGPERTWASRGRVGIYEFSRGRWSSLSLERFAGKYLLGALFVRDARRDRILLLLVFAEYEQTHRIYELRGDMLNLIPSSNAPRARAAPAVVYHPEYDGIFMYGGYGAGFLGTQEYREAWLAKYIEEENRFEWQRLD